MTAKRTNSMSLDNAIGKVLAAYIQAVEAGEKPDREAILAAHPELASDLAAFFADQEGFDRMVMSFRSGPMAATRSQGIPSAAISETPLVASRRFGDYELIHEIARGGMGVVFKARNVRLDRVVALKMILAGQLATPAEVERFRAEAENAARLDHPHIVPLYEVGEQDGHHFFTMRFVEGGSVAEHVTKFGDTPKAAAELMTTVARAVHYAHQRGVLHRDLKPANIMLDGSGQPQVTDFGLSKRLAAEHELLTFSGIVGTPSYMAPEQATGRASVSTATDVFSLGAIFYELLTGRSPFRADTPFDTLIQVMQKEPTSPRALNPSVDRDLDTICLKCLEKEPERRYGSAEAMADDLQRWMSGLPIKARRIGMVELVVKWARRKPSAAALIAVSAVAAFTIIAVLAYGFWAIAEEKGRTEKALEKYKSAFRSEQAALGEARQNAYYQTIALTAPEILANDIRRADGLLDSCPTELRQWEWFALKHLCHSEITSVACAFEPAAMAFSPDGKTLITAGGSLGEPGIITIRDATDGRELKSFRGHKDTINGLALDPSGTRLATAGRDGVVAIWDISSGRQISSLRGHALGVSAVAYSPDGRWVASAGDDRTVKVWDATTGKEWRSLSGHTGSVLALTFHRGGMLLASGGIDCEVKLWDLEKKSHARTLQGHSGPVRGLEFSPDGQLLASGAYDATARVWRVETGKELCAHRGHTRFVTGVAFGPDGRYVASSSLDGTVRAWDANTGDIAKILRGHAGGIWRIDFSSDGRRIASIGEDRTVKLWDATILALNSDVHTAGRPTTIHHASLGDGGNRLAICSQNFDSNQTFEVWDIPSRRILFSSEQTRTPSASVTLSRDGSTVAFAQGDVPNSTIQVLAVDSGEVRGKLNPHKPPLAMALSSDGRRLAAMTRGGGAILWKVGTDQPNTLREDQAVSKGEISNPPRPLFDPLGRLLVLSEPNPDRPTAEALGVFDATSGKRLATIPDAISPLAFSNDGRLLITTDAAGNGQSARIIDSADGRALAQLQGHTGPIMSAIFSADGDRIVTSSRDGTIKVWNAAGRELMTLPDERRIPTQLQFNPVDQRLVGIDDSGSVFTWEAGPLNPRDSSGIRP